MQASHTAALASKEALIPKQMSTAVWQSVQRFEVSRIQGQDGCPFDKQLICQCRSLLPWKQPRTSCPAASCCRVQESMQCRSMRAIMTPARPGLSAHLAWPALSRTLPLLLLRLMRGRPCFPSDTAAVLLPCRARASWGRAPSLTRLCGPCMQRILTKCVCNRIAPLDADRCLCCRSQLSLQ